MTPAGFMRGFITVKEKSSKKMHILIAPNAFKNSPTATEAAAAILQGLFQSNLDCSCACFPVVMAAMAPGN
jgi:hypothetical protein